MKHACRVVLISGGSSGIGAATALYLAQRGMTVYVLSRSGKIPEGVQDNWPGCVIPLQADVNDVESLTATVNTVVSRESTLDVLICNAGNGIAGSIEDTNEEEARYQFETCFFGVLKCLHACLPQMRKQGYGRILTTTSVAAVIPLPYQAFYSAVKAALLSLTASLQMEVKRFGIQCGSVLPGDTRTGFTAARRLSEAAQNPDSPYYEKALASIRKMEHDEQNGMAPERIARAIYRQLTRRRMAARVTPRLDYQLIHLLIRLLPTRLALWVIGLLY